MSGMMPNLEKVGPLLSIWDEYRKKRFEFLNTIGIPESNKDPLSEFSEVLIANLLGGKKAKSRVQKGYDIIADGKKIQVKYLSNPPNNWINWHIIKFTEDMDKYALVYFENLIPQAIFIFKKQNLSRICRLLGKRHKNQDQELQFTKSNYFELLNEPEIYEKEGIDIINLKHI